MINNLNNGLSGCKLEIIDNKIIRKYSSSLQYNQRFLNQISKQNFFQSLIFKNIGTSKIFSQYLEDLYFYDMEYISGMCSYDFFSISNKKDIDFVIDSLFGYFDSLSFNFKIVDATDSVLEKILNLQKTSIHKDFLEFLKIKKVLVPNTFCHGDLTFENIIFHPRKIYFIDFLDSYVNSFLCDLIKIKQDLHYHWSLKIQNKNSIRVVCIYKYIWNQIEKRYKKFIKTESFDVLDCMNILRIEPYLTDSNQKTILNNILYSTNLYEDFNCTNGRKII